MPFNAPDIAAVPCGSAVAVLVSSDSEAAVAWLACSAAGRACLMLSAGYPIERDAPILRDGARDALILGRDVTPPAFPPTFQVIELRRVGDSWRDHAAGTSRPR